MSTASTTALTTGGTSGIGRAAAQLFSDQGTNVIISGRDEVRGRQVAAETKGRFIRADLTSPEDVRRLADVAHVIAYLAGEQARPITGTVLAVDAGRISTL